ncbi:hypothetical protein SAMN05428975_5561 [Mucilaginibacter sp. OK268]|jgi:hypothetical protein|uniref:hypothetical protein n=1 Tax=Mucilaginibacter sp. OK268 TaxID=1881048 RepID=UPI00087EDDB3|nr:hypothetical protein [Mucilaginibacter sp. OK268]SDQ00927.1 hypothetical protein SAMN05428975_5561 [Mucilaginibacter sp. OK268]
MKALLSAVTMLHPTKIDTLQTQISHLTQTIDSLKQATIVNTIATGYFHDILNSLTMIFILIVTVIVSFAGVISWRTITNRFVQERRALEETFTNRINEGEENVRAFINSYTTDSQNQSRHTLNVENQVQRSIFTMMAVNNQPEYGVRWGLLSVQSYLTLQNEERASDMMDLVIKACEKAPINADKLGDDGIKATRDLLDDLKKVMKGELLTKVEGFEKKFLIDVLHA